MPTLRDLAGGDILAVDGNRVEVWVRGLLRGTLTVDERLCVRVDFQSLAGPQAYQSLSIDRSDVKILMPELRVRPGFVPWWRR